MQLLALSGSLRSKSSNTELLRAATALAPDNVETALYDGIGELPRFNPDLEDALPPRVVDFRARVATEASVALPLLGQRLDVNGIIERPELASAIRKAIDAFVKAIRTSSVTIAG